MTLESGQSGTERGGEERPAARGEAEADPASDRMRIGIDMGGTRDRGHLPRS